MDEDESALSLLLSWSTLARLAWLVWSLPNLPPSRNRVQSYFRGWELLLVWEDEGAGVCGCWGEVVRGTSLGRGIGCLSAPRASGVGGGSHG